jgi:N-methylhydantoinase A
MLDRAGVAAGRRRFERSVDARYERQSYELSIAVAARRLDAALLAEIAESFHGCHRATYGHDNRAEPVQLVSVRLTAVGEIAPLAIKGHTAPAGTNAIKSEREVWFAGGGAMTAKVYDRRSMPAGLAAQGPLVIESLESTILVPPHWRACMSDDGFVVLAQGKGERQ